MAGHLIEAGLDGDRHARRQIAIEPQVAIAEARRARAPRRVAGAVAEVFHVVHVEAEQVARRRAGKNSACAPRSKSPSTSPRKMPRSTRPVDHLPRGGLVDVDGSARPGRTMAMAARCACSTTS